MRDSTSSTPSSTGSAPPLQPGAGAARDPGDLLARARLDDRLDLLGAVGQHRGGGRRVVLQQPVGLVGAQLMLGRVDPLVADDPLELLDQRGDVARALARRFFDLRGTLGRRLYTTIHDNTAVDWR